MGLYSKSVVVSVQLQNLNWCKMQSFIPLLDQASAHVAYQPRTQFCGYRVRGSLLQRHIPTSV